MALTFTSVSNETRDAGAKILTFGPAGIGKTVLTATLPRPVLISAESGTLSLRKANLERLFGVGNPMITYDMPLIVIRTVDDLAEAYQWATMSAEVNNFDTIALDSISEIAEQVLSNAKASAKDPRLAYGDMMDQMEKLVRAFRDINGKHVYMSAKQAPQKDELTGITKNMPSMPGQKLGPALPYFFDEVFALRAGKDAENKDYRYLQTSADLQFDCKDRSGMLDAIEFPHLGAVINKILSA